MIISRWPCGYVELVTPVAKPVANWLAIPASFLTVIMLPDQWLQSSHSLMIALVTMLVAYVTGRIILRPATRALIHGWNKVLLTSDLAVEVPKHLLIRLEEADIDPGLKEVQRSLRKYTRQIRLYHEAERICKLHPAARKYTHGVIAELDEIAYKISAVIRLMQQDKNVVISPRLGNALERMNEIRAEIKPRQPFLTRAARLFPRPKRR